MKDKNPTNAIFYGNYKDMIYSASPEQVKALMVAFCQYAFDDITPQVPSDIALVWGIVKGNIDDDKRQYIARCEQNRENALKRHNKDDNTDKPVHTPSRSVAKSSLTKKIKMEDMVFDIEYTEQNEENIPTNGNEVLSACAYDMDIAQYVIHLGNQEHWIDQWNYYVYKAQRE